MKLIDSLINLLYIYEKSMQLEWFYINEFAVIKLFKYKFNQNVLSKIF